MIAVLCAILCPMLVILGVVSISGAPNMTWYEKAFSPTMIYAGLACGLYAIYSLITFIF